MEVHRQRCQACDSIELRNILVREPGHPTIVYVRCARCFELVAYYELSQYYHHHKGIVSYLHDHSDTVDESGRKWLQDFRDVQTRATEGYLRAIEQLKQVGKEI